MIKEIKTIEVKKYCESIEILTCDFCKKGIFEGEEFREFLNRNSILRGNLLGCKQIENTHYGETLHLCNECYHKILVLFGKE